MAVDVIMPQMGESIFEGTITRWLKKPGDRVERDEPLFEISTDKVDAEIPAPSAGVLKEIKVTEGQTVPIQTVVAVIDAAGAAALPLLPPLRRRPLRRKRPLRLRLRQRLLLRRSGARACSANACCRQRPLQRPRRPRRRRAAMAKKFAVPRWSGSWPRNTTWISPRWREAGRVDASARKIFSPRVESGGAKPAAPARCLRRLPRRRPLPRRRRRPAGGAIAHPALENAVPRERIYFGNYEAQPMSVMRQRIAEHMVASKRVSPHVYSIDEADMTRSPRSASVRKPRSKPSTATKLTFMPFFVRACVEALRAFPTVNASADGATVVLHREINVGIAVALDWGLIVPVLKNAEEKNFLGLARGMNDLAERARAKKLKPEEVQEGTFSITNPGVYGGLMGLPVINQPNVAILGIGAIQKRPMVIDDAIAIRSMVYLTLSYDHRVVDGAVAHQFVGKVKAYLEGWSEEVL